MKDLNTSNSYDEGIKVANKLLENQELKPSDRQKTLFFRAGFYEGTRNYLSAIKDYSDAIELTGILRMRSILRLKTLCVEACSADCLSILPEKQRSTEEFINSVKNA